MIRFPETANSERGKIYEDIDEDLLAASINTTEAFSRLWNTRESCPCILVCEALRMYLCVLNLGHSFEKSEDLTFWVVVVSVLRPQNE